MIVLHLEKTLASNAVLSPFRFSGTGKVARQRVWQSTQVDISRWFTAGFCKRRSGYRDRRFLAALKSQQNILRNSPARQQDTARLFCRASAFVRFAALQREHTLPKS
jgi:hypothetical protein